MSNFLNKVWIENPLIFLANFKFEIAYFYKGMLQSTIEIVDCFIFLINLRFEFVTIFFFTGSVLITWIK
jgi:hypothetical protein